MYGKLCLFIFAAWAGAEVRRPSCLLRVQAPTRSKRRLCWSAAALLYLHRCRRAGGQETPRLRLSPATHLLQGNGVIVGLAICGVVLAATSAAAVLMGDFRTGGCRPRHHLRPC